MVILYFLNMPRGSFYVYLNSNSNYPYNTAQKFTVQLPEELEFNSSWSVKLDEFIYTHSWPTIGSEGDQYIDMLLKMVE